VVTALDTRTTAKLESLHILLSRKFGFPVRAKKVKCSLFFDLLTKNRSTSKKKEYFLIPQGNLSKKVNANVKI
jgi:hypothetical protein